MTRSNALVGLILAATGISGALAQNPAPELDCDTRWMGGRRGSDVQCEMRELTIPATDSLSVSGGASGSVRVHGWDSDEVRVRAQVVAWDREDESARELIEAIEIRTDGELRAEGPASRNYQWSVSFEIWMPRDSDLRVHGVNGSIDIAGIEGALDAGTTNGRVVLNDVADSVAARSTNGAVDVGLAARSFAGDSIDLETTNGAIRLKVPEDFSARLDVRTVNGGIRSDVPMRVDGRARNWLDATIGNGDALVKIRSTNGGVRIGQ